MSTEELAEIRERVDGASEGPWEPFSPTSDVVVRTVSGEARWVAEGSTPLDAVFIAHARTDVPKLVDRVVVLEAELANRTGYDREDGWLTQSSVACVSCPQCAFTFDAGHVTDGTDSYSCPNCAEIRLEAELGEARELLRVAYGIAFHNSSCAWFDPHVDGGACTCDSHGWHQRAAAFLARYQEETT